VVAIKDLFEAILKRAEEAKAHGIKPRLSRSKTEYFITIPQGYKTRLYKIIIIKGSKGISIQTYDRGKMQYNEKLPEATMEEVLKRLPLDFLVISAKDEARDKKKRNP
jgi:2-iminoacetate synthase ThiH